MKLTEIQDLIKFVARAGVTEVEIEQKDFKLTIKSEMPKGRGKKEEQVVQTIQVPAAMPQMVQAAPRGSCTCGCSGTRFPCGPCRPRGSCSARG